MPHHRPRPAACAASLVEAAVEIGLEQAAALRIGAARLGQKLEQLTGQTARFRRSDPAAGPVDLARRPVEPHLQKVGADLHGIAGRPATQRVGAAAMPADRPEHRPHAGQDEKGEADAAGQEEAEADEAGDHRRGNPGRLRHVARVGAGEPLAAQEKEAQKQQPEAKRK